jgi:carbamate kinase
VQLDSIGADTQGALGYMIQQQLANEFRRRKMPHRAVSVVTQVLVDADDPAFRDPTKPIGSFMDEATANQRATQEQWDVKEERGRGWRRVVASPEPREILELGAIRDLLDRGHVVIAVGGGGIPVVRGADGELRGAAAVIDKDLASAVLAAQLGADAFIISTGVQRVCIDWGKPTQRELSELTLADAKRYLAEGQFPPGSMGPKISAVVRFLEQGGKRAIITSPEHLADAVAGKHGTQIHP